MIKNLQIEKEYEGLFHDNTFLESAYFPEEKLIPVNEKYKYINKKKSWIVYENLCAFAGNLLASLLKVFMSVKVVGRKNIKDLKKKNGEKGILTLSNHLLFLDNILIRLATKYKYRINYIVSHKNSIKGHTGTMMRGGGIIPLPTNMKGLVNFSKALEEKLKEGKAIHFFAEKELWYKYKKPRPLNDGVFHYSYVNEVPILPMFITYKKRKYFFGNKFKLHIMEAIYPNTSLTKIEDIKRMRDICEEKIRQVYEKEYNLSGEALYKISDQGIERNKKHINLIK